MQSGAELHELDFNTWLRVDEVAQFFKTSISSIWRWTKERNGFPQPVRMPGGRTTRWRRRDVEAYFDRPT